MKWQTPLLKIHRSSRLNIFSLKFSFQISFPTGVLKSAWQSEWSAHTLSARWYKYIFPFIHRYYLGFINSKLDRCYIVAFIRLRLRHNRLPAHAIHLNIKSFPYYTRNVSLEECNLQHILFNCSLLSHITSRLFALIKNMSIVISAPYVSLLFSPSYYCQYH